MQGVEGEGGVDEDGEDVAFTTTFSPRLPSGYSRSSLTSSAARTVRASQMPIGSRVMGVMGRQILKHMYRRGGDDGTDSDAAPDANTDSDVDGVAEAPEMVSAI